ncbi:MAG: phosphate signaling complex protein PhoU [Myxococcales bacterium]|nr:phosphate signaling complex protein PhoU [Myxococcales bacterium]MDD9964657.1 phosphate signaling complex protein PhoU [Myxococcales bacterium]
MDHTDREYHHKLGQIRSCILRMAGLVEKMIGDSVAALLNNDLDLARSVMERDREVDGLELEIDDLSATTLARWQPMASDLRFVILSVKMVTDLERIGDLAVNIAERTPDFAKDSPRWRWDEVEQMSGLAQSMVHDAIDAFLTRSVDKAQAVIDQDDLMDQTYERAFELIFSSIIAAPVELRLGVHGLSIAKWLERIGDHATNLAEQVIFMLKGKDVRHAARARDAES